MTKLVKTIQVASITVPKGLRLLVDGHLARTPEPVHDQALQRIVVDKHHVLLDGVRQYAAAKANGRATTIVAESWDEEEIDLKLAEINNIFKQPYTKLTLARVIARVKVLYLIRNSKTTRSGIAPSFVNYAARKTSTSRRMIQDVIAIGEGMTESAESIVTGTPIENNRTALCRIALADRKDQAERAKWEVENHSKKYHHQSPTAPSAPEQDTEDDPALEVAPRHSSKRIGNNGNHRKRKPEDIAKDEEIKKHLTEGKSVDETAAATKVKTWRVKKVQLSLGGARFLAMLDEVRSTVSRCEVDMGEILDFAIKNPDVGNDEQWERVLRSAANIRYFSEKLIRVKNRRQR